ncbi:AI-2E family transporter [Lachnoclostridium sp.]|nr:AI-2E family transporter [Lachnoclostridium sp.]
MEFNSNNVKKIIFIITFTVFLYVGIQHFDVILMTFRYIIGILTPFILGGCIAFILNVPLCLFEDKLFRRGKTQNRFVNKIRRPVSILLSIILVASIIFTVTFLIIPELIKTVSDLAGTINAFVLEAQKWVEVKAAELLIQYPDVGSVIKDIPKDWANVSTGLVSVVKGLFYGVLGSAFSIISNIISGLTTFLIGFVFAMYILANKEKLSEQGKKLCYSFISQKRADRIIMVLQLIHRTFSNFLSGQCIEAVILGSMFYITLSILRFPYALLIGVLIAFTALIPIVGAFIGSFIGTFLIFMVDPVQALWFIVIFNVLQQIEGNFIYPHVVGGSVGLPSIWVLFAVTIGGSLMGVIGMLIFIPLTSVLYTLLRENVKIRLNQRQIPEEKYIYSANNSQIPQIETLEQEVETGTARGYRKAEGILSAGSNSNKAEKENLNKFIKDGSKDDEVSTKEVRIDEARKDVVRKDKVRKDKVRKVELPNQKETHTKEKKNYGQLERISKDEK